jgi:hypothetical protein
LRRDESVTIDEESERAVSRWVRLGDQMSGRPPPEERTQCARCGSIDNVLDRGKQALCAHCYLENGAPAANDGSSSEVGAERATEAEAGQPGS